MKFVAYTTKGLEEIAKREILHKIDAKIIIITDKRIIFDPDINLGMLTELSTVDDIGILAIEASNIKRLDQLEKIAGEIDFEKMRQQIIKYRKLTNSFSLTITTAGSAISAKEITEVLKKKVEEKYNWEFTELDHTNFDIRVFIDHTDLVTSVRITKESLHHRAYKTQSKPGSLKPTIAAAMVQLATNFENKLIQQIKIGLLGQTPTIVLV